MDKSLESEGAKLPERTPGEGAFTRAARRCSCGCWCHHFPTPPLPTGAIMHDHRGRAPPCRPPQPAAPPRPPASPRRPAPLLLGPALLLLDPSFLLYLRRSSSMRTATPSTPPSSSTRAIASSARATMSSPRAAPPSTCATRDGAGRRQRAPRVRVSERACIEED